MCHHSSNLIYKAWNQFFLLPASSPQSITSKPSKSIHPLYISQVWAILSDSIVLLQPSPLASHLFLPIHPPHIAIYFSKYSCKLCYSLDRKLLISQNESIFNIQVFHNLNSNYLSSLMANLTLKPWITSSFSKLFIPIPRLLPFKILTPQGLSRL